MTILEEKQLYITMQIEQKEGNIKLYKALKKQYRDKVMNDWNKCTEMLMCFVYKIY